MNIKSQHQLATPRGLVNFYLDQLYIMKKKGRGARMPSGSMITEGAIRVTLERLKELTIRHNNNTNDHINNNNNLIKS